MQSFSVNDSLIWVFQCFYSGRCIKPCHDYLLTLIVLFVANIISMQCITFLARNNSCFVLLVDKEAADKRKLVSKWHPSTKGALKRNYRVPSKSEGRRLLKAIASILSDDDHFTDATTHKVIEQQIYQYPFFVIPFYIHILDVAWNHMFYKHWIICRVVRSGGRVLMVKAYAATMLELCLMSFLLLTLQLKLRLFLQDLSLKQITSRLRNWKRF